MPMLRAVPAIMRSAAYSVVALRSGILILAISVTLALGIEATLVLLGAGEPFSMPAALSRSTAAGGVFKMKSKERSSKTVISTGTMVPAWSWVLALYSLQNCMMLTPC